VINERSRRASNMMKNAVCDEAMLKKGERELYGRFYLYSTQEPDEVVILESCSSVPNVENGSLV